jgi:diguanylate cyclase (GGDEF)-like protein/PAS domain S-box-containing protein
MPSTSFPARPWFSMSSKAPSCWAIAPRALLVEIPLEAGDRSLRALAAAVLAPATRPARVRGSARRAATRRTAAGLLTLAVPDPSGGGRTVEVLLSPLDETAFGAGFALLLIRPPGAPSWGTEWLREAQDALACRAPEFHTILARATAPAPVATPAANGVGPQPVQALALEAAAHAMVLTDREGMITWANPAFSRMTGYAVAEVLGSPLRLYQGGQQNGLSYQERWTAIQEGAVWHGELINRRQDGSLYIEEETISPVRDATGAITHFLSVGEDITERKQHEERLHHQASHDLLTNLPNRQTLEEALERAAQHARRGRVSTLLFLDLDNFKIVNDTLGHAAGDQLLIILTQILSEQLRQGDLLARVGGDEFAVLLEGLEVEPAAAIAERMRAGIAEFPFILQGHRFDLGLSIGLVPIDGQQPADVLLAEGDIAMYTAKEQGRNRIIRFQPDAENLVRLTEAHQWARRIKDALRDDRMLFYFQPVLRVGDAVVVDYEALLRMRAEDGTLIQPGGFLPAAERFGLMPLLDRWMVQEAVRTLAAHPAIRLTVNLSAYSPADEALLDHIAEQLRDQVVAPARLAFAMSEAAVLQDLRRAEHWIRRLTDLGCRFVLDEFGTGFASLTYLRHLPVDQVKIDGSFIRMLVPDPSTREIVRAIHTLARALGKETVAIFVEDAATLDIVRAIGVTYAQGYHLSHPTPDLPPVPAAS